MPVNLLILNGPNLNLLGEREPEIYGRSTLGDVEENCHTYAMENGIEIQFLQSNHEGVLVDWIQEARKTADALIINPAGTTFHSVPIYDALKVFGGPIIELHISNIHARDDMHRYSKISPAATGVICGLGIYGYIAAIKAAVHLISSK